MKTKTPDLYPKGAKLSIFIHEGRPTTTKPTLVALPYLTSYSTFHECSRGTPCQPQASLHRHWTKPVVITSYSIHLERRTTLLSTFITRWNTTMESTQRCRFTRTQRIQPPSKLVSTLPAPLPNRHKSYLHRILHLHRHNLY